MAFQYTGYQVDMASLMGSWSWLGSVNSTKSTTTSTYSNGNTLGTVDALSAAQKAYSSSGMISAVSSSGSSAASAAGSSGFSGFSGSGVLGGVSIGLAIGQAVGSVYNAYNSMKTAKYVAKANERIAENNRQIAQMGVESAYLQRDSQIAKLTYEAGQTKAKQRTAYGASGVAVNVGSSAEVLASTDIMKEVDKKTVRMNALSTAWNYKSQVYQAEADKKTFAAMGSYYSSMTPFVVGGSLLNGATNVASKWYSLYGS